MTDVLTQEAAQSGGSSATARWVGVCRWGAWGAFAWAIVLQVVIGTLVPPMAIIGALFGTLAFFLRGERRVLAITTGFLALLAIGANLPGTIDELSNPDSGVAFWMTLLVATASTVSFLAAVALLARRSAAATRPVLYGAGGVLAAGLVVAIVATAGVESTQAFDGDVRVLAELNRFDVTELTVSEGTTGFWLDNRDGIRHTLTIDGAGDEIDVPGYSTKRGDFDLEAGEYLIYCSVPGHESMQIDLTVEPSN